jgi:hypothetical protein
MKLIISEHVLKKILFWNSNDNRKEISGSALYQIIDKTKTGYPETILLEDFIIHDMGSFSTTEFDGKTQASIFKTWKGKINENTIIGIIHSHVEMETRHSTVDVKEIEESTPLLNFFISSIFNHNLSISSKISYKDQYGFVKINDIKNIEYGFSEINKEFNIEKEKVLSAYEAKSKNVLEYRSQTGYREIGDYFHNNDYYTGYSNTQIHQMVLEEMIRGNLKLSELEKKYVYEKGSWITKNKERKRQYSLLSDYDKLSVLIAIDLFVTDGILEKEETLRYVNTLMAMEKLG